jgi:hypothetical protein
LVTRNPYPGRRMGGFGGFGMGGPVPRDVVVILAVLLATFALRFFESTAIVPAALELTSRVWTHGWIWQLATYPFIGAPASPIALVIALVILYMFGRDVYFGLYRKHFWRLILWSSIGGALVAVAVHALLTFAGLRWAPSPFVIMQGQWMLTAILIAAFGTSQRDATVYLMFFLPVPAIWMLGVEILFAFLAYLFTKDLPGFFGISAAVGLSYLYVRSSGSMRGGRRSLREMRLRLEKWWIQRKLDRARRRRGFKVIPGDKGPNVRKGPWVN